ncbi:hypothetical protein ACFLZT_01520 [Thermodesulfobacteriota bacterium]
MSTEDSKDCNANKICGQVQIPTEDELKALNAMRLIKERVNEIKQKLSNKTVAKADKREKVELERELGRLKAEWKEWVEKREKAARERMILLGHEKP